MNITIIGAAGFIGTNLILDIVRNSNQQIHLTAIDRNITYFKHLIDLNLEGVEYKEADFSVEADFDEQLKDQDIVYHLASTVIPGNSNKNIPLEVEGNVVATTKMLDACVRQDVKKVIFISSGGAVYGKKGICPIKEDTVTYPISSYGVQKIAIEKLLYLYRYQFGLDYRIIRLANPYGPYQRPNGKLGVVTTFVYEALKGNILQVYGDGKVVRDFIFIDDAIRGIRNIANAENELRVFNLGSGIGHSVNQVIDEIKNTINSNIKIEYIASRPADVPENYLDISRYEKYYGKLKPISLHDGILKTADFLRGLGNYYD